MRSYKIGLSVFITLLAVVSSSLAPNLSAAFTTTQILAQTANERKAEADRLFQQGIQQYQTSQFEAALQSWQQALIIYREIKDRQSEGAALGNLGVAYLSLGDYAKAIEYQQQWLAIAREIKDPQSEGAALGNLGVAYYSLGDYAKAIEYQQQLLAIAREIKDRQSEGIALNNLGYTHYRKGNLALAEKTLFAGITVLESLRGGLDDRNKVSIFEQQYRSYRTLQQVLIAQNKTDAALEIAERGRARAFVELLASRFNSQVKSQAPTIQEIKQIAKRMFEKFSFRYQKF